LPPGNQLDRAVQAAAGHRYFAISLKSLSAA
jgi:hypothetical protein